MLQSLCLWFHHSPITMRHSSTFPLLVLLAGMITPGRTVIGRPPNFPEGWNNPLLSNVTVPFLDADSSSGGDEVPLCRHKSYLPSALFEWDTCAWCYRYMHNVSITFGSPSKKFHTQLVFWTKGEYTFRILVMVGNNSLVRYTYFFPPLFITISTTIFTSHQTRSLEKVLICIYKPFTTAWTNLFLSHVSQGGKVVIKI